MGDASGGAGAKDNGTGASAFSTGWPERAALKPPGSASAACVEVGASTSKPLCGAGEITLVAAPPKLPNDNDGTAGNADAVACVSPRTRVRRLPPNGGGANTNPAAKENGAGGAAAAAAAAAVGVTCAEVASASKPFVPGAIALVTAPPIENDGSAGADANGAAANDHPAPNENGAGGAAAAAAAAVGGVAAAAAAGGAPDAAGIAAATCASLRRAAGGSSAASPGASGGVAGAREVLLTALALARVAQPVVHRGHVQAHSPA